MHSTYIIEFMENERKLDILNHEKIFGIRSQEKEKILDDIPFEGFNHKQEVWVKKQIYNVGLPIDHLTKVRYEPSKKGKESVMGQTNSLTGEMTLYKSLSILPKRAQLDTIVHESSHINSPFIKGNVDVYGEGEAGENNQKYSRNLAVNIARQSIESNVFINGYQKALAKALLQGKIEPQRYIEETNAIMIEQRFTNPNHLRKISDSQKKTLEKKKKAGMDVSEFTPITAGRDIFGRIKEAEGVDRTIMALIPGIKSSQGLELHTEWVRKSFLKRKTPIKP